jgi:hypothetical protein
MDRRRIALAIAAVLLLPAAGARAATITVTTTEDDITPNDGVVSLREAITALDHGNTLGDPDIAAQDPTNPMKGYSPFGVNDTIKFNIAADGKRQVIMVGNTGNGPLTELTSPMTINGTTEQRFAGVPLIALDGANAGANADGILVEPGGGGSTIRGLDIFDFSLNQIELQSSTGVTVAGNDIGWDTTGNPTRSPTGVRISNALSDVIGGTTAADRNVISGNLESGVDIVGSQGVPAFGNVVEGNFIGTDASGKAADGNARFPPYNSVGAVQISGADASHIGGTTAGAGNVISGNGSGVDIRNGASLNFVQGNFIGVASDGVTPLPNAGFGVRVQSDDNLFPPAGPGQTNEPPTVDNIIGLNPFASFNGQGNVIADNGGDGVLIDGSVLPNNATPQENSGNSINGNSIYGNGGLGIDLKVGTGLAAHLPPNNLLGAPTVASATAAASSTTVQGTVNLPGRSNMSLRIEVFASPGGCGSSPQGQTFLGATTATTSASGTAAFSLSVAPLSPGEGVTATDTNTTADPTTPTGNIATRDTSEFSQCLVVPKRSTSAAISCVPKKLSSGKNATCTVTVSDTAAGTTSSPTGVVTVSSTHGGSVKPSSCTLKPDPGGASTCTFKFRSAKSGKRTISASYGGDSAHLTSAANQRITVRRARKHHHHHKR